MSSGAFRLLAKVQLGAAKGTVYDPGAVGHIGPGEIARVLQIVVANTAAATKATTVYYTPSGTVAGTPEQLIPGSSMNANESVFITGAIPLAFGDKLEGFAATAAVVNVFVFGEAPAQ